jgi:hypothetical protein
MQKVRVAQNSFQFGEISDSLIMRTDSPVYVSSAQRVENMVVTAEGSLKKRKGLKNHYDYSLTYNATYPEQSHLFKFEFDDNESYVISVEHQKVRCFFLDNAGTYTTAGGLHLVETITQDTSSNSLPFDQEYLQEYTFAQYGDVMFICHPLFAPRMLTRTSLTDFEISAYSFDQRADNKVTYQPYSKFQANGVTLDPSATTGSGVTLTTSSAYWVAGHVGTTIRYGGSEIEITGYTSSTVVTGTVVDELKIRLSVLNPLRTIDGAAIIEVTHLSHGFSGGESITVEEASAVGGINASQINGARTVGDIIDENTYTITAASNANKSEDGGGNVKIVTHAPTEDWDEQSWSGVRGYPAAVTFHENRLCFGGTIAEPDNIWMSGVGNFFNFDVGDAADSDSIQIVAATGDVNQIRYMVSNRDLQIFTATGELYVPTYLNQAITPTNAQIRKQTPYGCEFVQPTSIDGATIFSEMGGKTVREYLYTDTEEAYTATSISTIASHLIDTPKYLAVVHSGFGLPDSYAAFTLSNGQITLFSSNRAEKKASWTRVTTDGIFSSVCAIHNRLFVNTWYNNKLQLCEFTGQLGADNHIEVSVPSSIPVIANSTFDLAPSGYGPSNQDTGKWYYNSTSPDTDLWHRFQMPDSNYIYRLNRQGSNTISDGTVFYKADFPMYKSNIYTFQYTLYTAGAMGTGVTGAFHDIRLRIYSGIFSRYTGSYKTYSDMIFASTTFTEDVIVSHDISNPTITFQAKSLTDTGTYMIGLDNVTINGVAVNMNALSSGFVANETLASFENGSFAGNLTLDQNASIPVETYGGRTLTLGKKFTSKVVTNPVDASMGNGPATGEVRGITNVVVDVKNTDSLKVNNRPVISSNFTGKKEVKLLGYNRNPQVTIEQDDPVDMQVNGLVAELIV